ncbi:MAG TPA: EAL domain-containing protein [Aestuariivirga sp.]|nr:EAL domain-containing protein [Aestuariivirga sp.]
MAPLTSVPAPLTMSVNVSPRQFDQPDFVEQVVAAVKNSGARPETIRLEITESVALNDPGRAILILERLHEFGVRVSVDDFGTGYSSLSYLQQRPFDTLKIDRSFVNALQEKTERGDLIRTILDLARNLDMEVVAEGVESREQVNSFATWAAASPKDIIFPVRSLKPAPPSCSLSPTACCRKSLAGPYVF